MAYREKTADTSSSDNSAESDSEMSDPELNITSPHFNPIKALYAPKVTGLAQGVKTFASVAEYEKKMLKPKKPKPKPSTSRSIHHEEQGPSAFRDRYRKPNVLKRMDETEGPRLLLKRCVEDKLKARVLTRGVKRVQSVYRGYIVAYDRFMNLAMIDVDETYRKHGPSSRKKKTQQSTHETTTVEPESAEVDPSQTCTMEETVDQAPSIPDSHTGVEGESSSFGATGLSETSPEPQTVIPPAAAGRERDPCKDVNSSSQPLSEGRQQEPGDRGDDEKNSAPRQESSVPGSSGMSTSTLCVEPTSKSSLPQESRLPVPAIPGSSKQSTPSHQTKSSQGQRVRKPGAYMTDEEVLGIRKSLIRHRHLGQILLLGSSVVAVYVQE